MDIDRKRI